MRAIACLLALCSLEAAEPPVRVDNSLSIHFPPIIRQVDESCAQEVGVSTILTYHWNRTQGTNAQDPANQMAGRFVWNFLNRGENRGAEVVEGWKIARTMGVPSVEAYDDHAKIPLGQWPSGYALYLEAMKYRCGADTFLPLRTEADLAVVRHRLFQGDLFAIEGRLNGFTQLVIPQGQFEAGKHLVTRWGRQGAGHVMTYVGYDDRVGYDVNGDGKLTNDVDLDGDRKITLADHESGAFIAVNSYGSQWGDEGKTYVLFRESAITPFQRGQWAATTTVIGSYHPLLTLRLRLLANCQTAIRLRVATLDGKHYSPPPFDGLPTHEPETATGPEQHSRFVTGKPRLALGPIAASPDGSLLPVELGLDLTGALPLNAEGYTLTFWLASEYPFATGTLLEAHLHRYHPDGTPISEIKSPSFPRSLDFTPQTAGWVE